MLAVREMRNVAWRGARVRERHVGPRTPIVSVVAHVAYGVIVGAAVSLAG